MGDIDIATMHRALEKAYVRFNLPRLNLTVTSKPRKSSWYKGGLNMVAINGGRWPALQIPKIQMACNMLTWKTFCHELSHHIHAVRYDATARAAGEKSGLNFDSSFALDRSRVYVWVRKNIPAQHGHGPQHRIIMQEVVDFFIEIGMITEMPLYKNPKVVAAFDTIREAIREAA